jgi:hypothetical protein
VAPVDQPTGFPGDELQDARFRMDLMQIRPSTCVSANIDPRIASLCGSMAVVMRDTGARSGGTHSTWESQWTWIGNNGVAAGALAAAPR